MTVEILMIKIIFIKAPPGAFFMGNRFNFEINKKAFVFK